MTAGLTLLAEDRLFGLALSFGLSVVRDFARHAAGHVELVDVQRGFTER